MKKNHLLIWACLIMSCSGNSEIFEPEIGYIDYANYPLEKLTQNDRTLFSICHRARNPRRKIQLFP